MCTCFLLRTRNNVGDAVDTLTKGHRQPLASTPTVPGRPPQGYCVPGDCVSSLKHNNRGVQNCGSLFVCMIIGAIVDD